MHTHNEIVVEAPLATCLEAAADVERWPEILHHYRDVHFRRRDGPGTGRVVMAAYRHFGPLPYPVWWESEMVTDFDAAEVRYRHVDGITRGMDVLWRLETADDGEETAGSDRASDTAAGSAEDAAREHTPRTRIVILHDWDGPAWPLIGRFAADRIIGPHFIHVVADRTLAGIRRAAERRSAGAGEAPGGDVSTAVRGGGP